MPRRILVIDIGGTTVKYRVTGHAPGHFCSGPDLTPQVLLNRLQNQGVLDTPFDAVSIGYPGVVDHGVIHERGPGEFPIQGKIVREPIALGPGWLGCEGKLSERFCVPLWIVNDAVLQAIGMYSGERRLLFLGFGTFLGTCMIAAYRVIPVQLGILPFRDGAHFGKRLGRDFLDTRGIAFWLQEVLEAVVKLQQACIAETVVISGGNAVHVQAALDVSGLDPLRFWGCAGIRLSTNEAAFEGGEALWEAQFEFI